MAKWILPGSLSIVETNLGIHGREGSYETPGVASEKVSIRSLFGNLGTTGDVATILYKQLQHCNLVEHLGKVKIIPSYFQGPNLYS